MTSQGWYQDPRFPGLLRWWDGDRWTEHTQAAAGVLPPPQPQPIAAPWPAPSAQFVQSRQQPWPASDPGRDLAAATKAGSTASKMVLVGAAGYFIEFIVAAFSLHSLLHQARVWLDGPRQPDGTLPPLHLKGAAAYSALSNIGSVLLLVVGILFLVWFHRAATMAMKLGLPARHSPGWAVAGFFIPILNLWWPYQAMRDLFPPGHRSRSIVKRWWALWIGTSLLTGGIYVAAWYSAAVAGVLAGLACLMIIGAGLSLRWLIADAIRCHTDLVAGQY